MLLQVVDVNRKRPNEVPCLFCDATGNFISVPKSQTFLTIQKPPDRRKVGITEMYGNHGATLYIQENETSS